MRTVRAWTRQVSQVLDEIESRGVYRVKEEYVRAKNGEIADYYLALYRWYTAQCRRRVEIPPECDLPIWLAVSEEQRLPPAPGTVSDPEDERRHNEELKRLGIGSEASLISTGKGNFYPLMKQKIIKSWDRIFSPSADPACNVGTIWEIRPEWIREVERYE